MIGSSGVGRTANFLYPNIECCCAAGMSFVTTDSKGDLYRNTATIAEKYYGYKISVINLSNPTRSSSYNISEKSERKVRHANSREGEAAVLEMFPPKPMPIEFEEDYPEKIARPEPRVYFNIVYLENIS